jgi:16S rRNA (guanine527-N7)-methyltransferase
MPVNKFSYEDFLRYQNVPRETFLKLEHYIELLKKWQKAINLVSTSTISDVWLRHIVDSAQLVKYISSDDKLVDIGSGAGFPGLVLAIMGVENITLVESDKRKATFLQEAARNADTRIDIINQRVENINLGDYNIITARAFASIEQTLLLLEKRLRTGHKLLLMKGNSYHKEIEDARKDWAFDCQIHPSVTDKASAILCLQSCRKLSQ